MRTHDIKKILFCIGCFCIFQCTCYAQSDAENRVVSLVKQYYSELGQYAKKPKEEARRVRINTFFTKGAQTTVFNDYYCINHNEWGIESNTSVGLYSMALGSYANQPYNGQYYYLNISIDNTQIETKVIDSQRILVYVKKTIIGKNPELPISYTGNEKIMFRKTSGDWKIAYIELYKGSIIPNIKRTLPFEIKSIAYKPTKTGDYGQPIVAGDVDYVYARLNMVVNTEGTYPFYIKVYNTSGILSKANSENDYSFMLNLTLKNSESYYYLTGWGNSDKTYYVPGIYRYEIWYNNQKVFSDNITVQDKITHKNAKVTLTASGADIYLKAASENSYVYKGNSSWEGMLPNGSYSAKTVRENYKDAFTTFEVNGENLTKALKMPSPTGKIYVTSKPTNANVYVDGKYVGMTPCCTTVETGSHNVYTNMSGYHTSDTKYVTIQQSSSESVDFTLKKQIGKQNWTDDSHPEHYFETSYGASLDMDNKYQIKNHNLGLEYAWLRRFFGLRLAPNLGFTTDKLCNVSMTAGPVFRITPMYSALNLQLCTGAGAVWDVSTNKFTWMVDGGLRFGFENDYDALSNFSWWSFGLGIKYYDRTIVPSINLSLMPIRTLAIAARAYEYPISHFFEATCGFALGNARDILIGGTYGWTPTHLGFFVSGMGGLDGSGTVSAGLDFRLIPEDVSDIFDWHIYAGPGWGMYNGDHHCIGDLGMRFAFNSGRSRFCFWSFSAGCQVTDGIVVPQFGLSFGIVGLLGTAGLGALLLY